MNIKTLGIILVIVVLVGLGFYYQNKKLQSAKEERDRYKNNTDVMMNEAKGYQTKERLNVMAVKELQFKISEFQRYRADDAALIKTLQIKNRDLKAVTTAQPQTVIKIVSSVRDSLIYLDKELRIIDTLRCITVVEKWFDFNGCADKAGQFIGTFTNRDSLLIAETVRYKRFLGFLWKTAKVKDRQIDIVSKNPNTKILGLEFTTIKR